MSITRDRRQHTLSLRAWSVWHAAVGITCVVGLGGYLGAAHAQVNGLIQLRYTQIEVIKAAAAPPALVEAGAYLIDSVNGRYRVDRFKGGRHSAEIIDYKNSRRVVLDMDRRQAIITGLPATLPTGVGSPSQRTTPLPQGVSTTNERVDLGTRTLTAGLVALGTRFIVDLHTPTGEKTHTFDRWVYTLIPGRPPILLEERFEGPTQVLDRRVVDVARTAPSDALFAIPSGFAVQDQRNDASNR